MVFETYVYELNGTVEEIVRVGLEFCEIGVFAAKVFEELGHGVCERAR